MCRLRESRLSVVALALAAASLPSFMRAESGERSASAEPPRDLLAAEAEGSVEVTFIANDSRSAQVVVRNRGDRPLTLRLPAAFAGIPVLAQMGGGMGQ